MSILLRIRHHEEARHHALLMAEIARDTAEDDIPPLSSTPGGDARRLRGIPAIGRNVAGAIPNTRPEDAIR